MVEAYPLQWPPGWPRTKYPERARFGDHSRGYAIGQVMDEIKRLGGQQIVISSNLELRNDGLPRASQRTPADQGVAVYFNLNGRSQCFPCDRWTTIEHNLWAIAKSIEALRGLERWGAKTMVDAAFRGFQALPAPDGSPMIGRPPWNVILGVEPNSSKEEIRRRYIELAKETHPDSGGSVSSFQAIKEAYEEGMRR